VRDLLREWKAEGRVRALGWALGPSIGWLAEGDAAVEYDEFDAVQTVFNLFEQEPGRHFIDTIRETGSDTSVIARVPHSSGLLNEQVTPDTVLEDGDHRAHRPTEWYEAGWEKVEAIRFLETPDDGSRTLSQAAIRWLLAHEEVASVTPTFRDGEDIAEWSAASEVAPISDAEYDRLEALYARNFGVDRDDGMDALRTSVDGEDIAAAGLDKRAASY
jgi:Predicted oxidoreductases (related to aryl-alcohol dehydrogenases)